MSNAEPTVENPKLDAVEKESLVDGKVKLYASTDHKADFLASIKSRQPPITDMEIGARTVTCCHLTTFACDHGQQIKWDPAKNEFAGGTGDAKWLTREYRGEWRVAQASFHRALSASAEFRYLN